MNIVNLRECKIKLLNKWTIILALIPFFEPSYLATIESIHAIFKYARIAVGIIILIYYLLYTKKSIFILTILLYNLALFVSTIVKQGDVSEWFSSASYVITICMIVEMMVSKNIILILQALYYLLGILTYINLVLLFVYPDGMYFTPIFNQTAHFLAGKNSLGAIFIPEIAIAIMYSTIRYKKMTFSALLLIITCSFSLVIVWSGTSIVGMAIVLLFLLFFVRKNTTKYVSFRSYMIVYSLLFLSIVILRYQNYFGFIIEDLLHKDLSLTGRTLIWDRAFVMIEKSPFVGYGFKKFGLYVPYIGFTWEAHNQFLQNMLKGGMLGTALFIMTIVLSGARLMKYKASNFSAILSTFIFAYLVMMLTDDYGNALLFYVLLTLAYHLPSIIEQGEVLMPEQDVIFSPLINEPSRYIR